MDWYDTLCNQLKPCPFCGQKGLGFYRATEQAEPSYKFHYYQVLCKNCGVTGCRSVIDYPNDDASAEEAAGRAVKVWNQRHISVPEYKLVEAHKEVIWQLYWATHEIDAKLKVDTQRLRDLITNLQKLELVDPTD